MNKTALITGITGQDGAYLARFLLNRGYRVFGTYRRLSTPNFWRLQTLGIFDKVELLAADLVDLASIIHAIRAAKPQELYHLAAQSFVGASFQQPFNTGMVTGLGVTNVLEAVRIVDPTIRMYQASSSEIFGGQNSAIQNERTPFEPASPYGAAKLYGHWVSRIYREGYNLFVCNGILFNHESPLRGLDFVTRKISNAAARISLGLGHSLRLGNLSASRDWGYAPEYVEAMWMILQHDCPDDYVIATGETHTVREFVEAAFDVLNLRWADYVVQDEMLFRPMEVNVLQGDYAKAHKVLHWQPHTKFTGLVELMVREDRARWERWQGGERFAWDAPYHPTDDKGLAGVRVPDR